MSAVDFYRERMGVGSILHLLDYDDTLSKRNGNRPPDEVDPEDGCIEAMKKLLKKGDFVALCSARPLGALEKGFGIPGLGYVHDEGYGIKQTGDDVPDELREFLRGPMPDWTATKARLSKEQLPEGAPMCYEGTAPFCFINNKHPQYSEVQASFQVEIAELNKTVDKKVERVDYKNGVQITRVDRPRKAEGIRELLRLLNIQYCGKDSYDFTELFRRHISGVIYFDDSPKTPVTEALQYIKDLPYRNRNGQKVGFAIKVANDNKMSATLPVYANQEVLNPKAVVAMLTAMAACKPDDSPTLRQWFQPALYMAIAMAAFFYEDALPEPAALVINVVEIVALRSLAIAVIICRYLG